MLVWQKMGLEMEMHAYDAQTLAPLGSSGTEITPQHVFSLIALQTKKLLNCERRSNKSSHWCTIAVRR